MGRARWAEIHKYYARMYVRAYVHISIVSFSRDEAQIWRTILTFCFKIY